MSVDRRGRMDSRQPHAAKYCVSASEWLVAGLRSVISCCRLNLPAVSTPDYVAPNDRTGGEHSRITPGSRSASHDLEESMKGMLDTTIQTAGCKCAVSVRASQHVAGIIHVEEPQMQIGAD